LVRQKEGNKVPSFIKQNMELRWNLLPTFLSNEPGTGNIHLNIQTWEYSNIDAFKKEKIQTWKHLKTFKHGSIQTWNSISNFFVYTVNCKKVPKNRDFWL
jgi:hypothetical protein